MEHHDAHLYLDLIIQLCNFMVLVLILWNIIKVKAKLDKS